MSGNILLHNQLSNPNNKSSGKPVFLLSIFGLFCLSFLLRALYICAWLEHRIVHFGDAYNFLRSGNCLYQLAVQSKSLPTFFFALFHPHSPSAEILQSMTSMNLTDRLLVDGPVYPAYLALIEWISGINPYHPIFESHSIQLCLCNAFIDSLSCLLVFLIGYLTFGKKTAYTAAILFAFYPAFIINTQHCYSEPFSYFLLCLWTGLLIFMLTRSPKHEPVKSILWIMLGFTSGLVMLVKPAFLVLPMLIGIVSGITYFTQNQKENMPSLSKCYFHFCLLLLGLAFVCFPWAYFNKMATGHFSLSVNRVPSFNIFHGNQLSTDGWRSYPYKGIFPGAMKAVAITILEEAKQKPVEFFALQFKKVARLWSGVWNEYHYSLFSIPLFLQSLWHQILLFLACLGFPLALIAQQNTVSNETNNYPEHTASSQQLSSSLTVSPLNQNIRQALSYPYFMSIIILNTIVLFHFIYLPFETISRYCITAMPFIILFASYALCCLWQATSPRFISLFLICAAFIFAILSQTGNLSNILASVLPKNTLELSSVFAWLITGGLFIWFMVLSLQLICRLSVKPYRFSIIAFPLSMGILTLVVSFCYVVYCYDWHQWSYTLNNPEKKIIQSIFIPGNQQAIIKNLSSHNPCAFVLIDLSSTTLLPHLRVVVNNTPCNAEVLPLAQLMPDNKDILQCLAIQGAGMSCDCRSFRQWWIMPFPSALLKTGKTNTITISTKYPDERVTIFGDFKNESVPVVMRSIIQRQSQTPACLMPSLYSFSYTKGFTTFDHQDPRPIQEEYVRGKTIISARQTGASIDDYDLSNQFGRQFGQYRVQILIPETTAAQYLIPVKLSVLYQPDNLLDKPWELISPGQEQIVVGTNPLSFHPHQANIALPDNLPTGTRFFFTCDLKQLHGHQPGLVDLTFKGLDNHGKEISWNSPWQPIAISLSSDKWITSSFGDIIPWHILQLHNIHVTVLFSPFQPDYLFLRKKQALQCAFAIRKARFSLLAPLPIPETGQKNWLIY